VKDDPRLFDWQVLERRLHNHLIFAVLDMLDIGLLVEVGMWGGGDMVFVARSCKWGHDGALLEAGLMERGLSIYVCSLSAECCSVAFMKPQVVRAGPASWILGKTGTAFSRSA